MRKNKVKLLLNNSYAGDSWKYDSKYVNFKGLKKQLYIEKKRVEKDTPELHLCMAACRSR